MKKTIFAGLIFLIANTTFADESIFLEMARFRQYESGADESDLKVRPILNSSNSKKKKQQIQLEPSEGF